MSEGAKHGIKKIIAGVAAAIALAFFTYWISSLWSRADVHSDGDTAQRITDDIHNAQDAVNGAADSLDRAEQSNQDAQDTAGDIEQGNKKLQDSAGTSAEAIDRFGTILEEIRNKPAKN